MLAPLSLKNTVALALLASAATVNAVFDCGMVVDGQSLNLTALAGPHTVQTLRSTPPSTTITQFTFDLCAPLQPQVGVPANQQCAAGTQVCGVQTIALQDETPFVAEVIPISGDLNGATAAHVAERRIGANTAKAGQSALSVNLVGGQWGDVEAMETFIDFACDPTLYDVTPDPAQLADTGSDTAGLRFVSWDEKTLNLRWDTAVVCDQELVKAAQNNNNNNNNETPTSSSTAYRITKYVLIGILLFAGAYFGATAYSNYRKGATGVDLLPSSETVMDVPYVARDFVKKIASGFSRSESTRDGYAAF
ncbi:autophagy-related protein 27 [Myxozyma melibiosi]|uniref:Autophagy-related protein 27 n=1 Tax=Myxozyma melibiosi TaxID=54550 RepID=A0ABR1F246_9ASCO